MGNFKQAVEYHNLHLSIAKGIGQRSGEGCAYGNLGNAYQRGGDVQRAIEYHTKHLSIAKELGQRDEEGIALYSLGCDFEFSGAIHEALHYYQSSVELYDEVRALLHYEDVWKITFRNARHDAYTALWRTHVKLRKTHEALLVAERGRAQALKDLMILQYDYEFSACDSFEPKGMISDILSDICAQTVFLALDSNTINLWVLKMFIMKNKESKMPRR